MSSTEKQERAKALFESRFLSIALMLVLLIMGALFIVVIWSIFGLYSATQVIIYYSSGIAGGVLITLIILLIAKKKKSSPLSRNLLLYIVGAILILSLLLAIILRFSFADEQLGSWLFIDTSSIGLGITTGIAISYLILAIVKSKLIFDREQLEKQKQIEETKEKQIL